MLKRKQQRDLNVGDLCSIKESFIDNITKTASYKENSCIYKSKDLGYSEVSSRIFRNLTKREKKKSIHIGDFQLVVVLEKSSFKNLVKVMPIVFQGDSAVSKVAKFSIEENMNCLVHKKSLNIASSCLVDKLTLGRSSTSLGYIERMIERKHEIKVNLS